MATQTDPPVDARLPYFGQFLPSPRCALSREPPGGFEIPWEERQPGARWWLALFGAKNFLLAGPGFSFENLLA